jgi:hypothetical protein
VIHSAAAAAATTATPQVQAQALKVIPVDEIRRRAAENPGKRLPPGGPNPPSSSGGRTHGQKLRRLGHVDRDRRSSEDLCACTMTADSRVGAVTADSRVSAVTADSRRRDRAQNGAL